MRTRRLSLILWLRMAVALLLEAGAVGLVLITAFVTLSVLSYFLLLLGWLFGGVFLLAVIVPGIGYIGLTWILSLSLGYAELSDLFSREDHTNTNVRMPDRQRTLKNPTTVWQTGRQIAQLCVIPVGLVVVSGLALLVFDRSNLDPVVPAVATGAVIIIGVVGWIIYDERHSTGSVRARLEAEYEHDSSTDRTREQKLQRRIRRLASQADSGVPAVEVGASDIPQAATVGYRPEKAVVLVSRGLFNTLDDRELNAVLAHELAHLLNRDAAVMTALAFPRSKITDLIAFLFESERRVDGVVIPLVLLSAPVYAVTGLVVPMVARHRTFAADNTAGELIDSDATMASALTALDQKYSTQETQKLQMDWPAAAFSVMSFPWAQRQVLDSQRRRLHRHVFRTHPSIKQRIKRLRSRNW
jgi:Zn-dependent protease with chaperone function